MPKFDKRWSKDRFAILESSLRQLSEDYKATLHPSDRARVLRIVEKVYGEAAASLEERNEKFGVPDGEA